MLHQPETPFDNIESSHAYVALLAEAVAEAMSDIEAEIGLKTSETERRQKEALQLVRFNLHKLRTNIESSRRILNDLRTLRRLLLRERQMDKMHSGIDDLGAV